MSISKYLQVAYLAACMSLQPLAQGADSIDMGPLYDEFNLTLTAGERVEALGPFFARDEQEEGVAQWSLPPLLSWGRDVPTDVSDFDLLYPLFTYDRFGAQYRMQLFQLLSLAGGEDQAASTQDRFTLFPFYFQQRSSDPDQNYTALFPLVGRLRNRIFRSEIDFVLWPAYSKTVRRGTLSSATNDPFLALRYRYFQSRRGDVTTYNYLYPIFHLRYGEGLKGWQLWPLVGHEHKEVTQRTNDWGGVEILGGHNHRFVLWPLFFDRTRDVGTTNAEHHRALLPVFSLTRSPMRDSTSYLWPLGVTITDDRGRKYREIGAPWPFVVFARGEGKTTTRLWPLFSQARNDTLQSDFYIWPIYKYNRFRSLPLDRERTRILFFLYSDTIENDTETRASKRRIDLWPLFTRRRDFDGNTRLQVLSVLEPLVPNNKSIERNYSPVWSLWRSENNAKTGARSDSLLWNLYRREASAENKKLSLLFGLFQYESGGDGKRWRLFYVPLGGGRGAGNSETKEAGFDTTE